MVVRLLRLLRLVYVLRMLETFKDLWKLTYGFFRSMRSIASAAIMILGISYLFACVGVEIMRCKSLKSDPEAADIVRTHFRSIPLLMLTFTQFATGDSLA